MAFQNFSINIQSFFYHLIGHIYRPLLTKFLLVYYSEVLESYLYLELFVILYQTQCQVSPGKLTLYGVLISISLIDTFINFSHTQVSKITSLSKYILINSSPFIS